MKERLRRARTSLLCLIACNTLAFPMMLILVVVHHAAGYVPRWFGWTVLIAYFAAATALAVCGVVAQWFEIEERLR